MAKKKQPVFCVERTFTVEHTLSRNVIEGIAGSVFDDLVGLHPSDKKMGVGVKHPLVAVLKELSQAHDAYGGDLVEDLKPTDQELSAMMDLIPSTVPYGFIDALSNWDSGDTDNFAWEVFPSVQEKKAFIDAVSVIFLPRLQEMLKKHQDEQAKIEAEEKKRAEERQARFAADKTARLRDAESLLRGAGYDVKAPPSKVVTTPAAKKAKKR